MTLEPASSFDRDWLAGTLGWLAERGIYLGTSSWKYPGWLGKIYDRERYLTRGNLSQSRFERDCLREHAEIFPTVCVDAGYYAFPTPKGMERLMEQTPDHYRLTFKVTEDITVRNYPKLARYGTKAGKANEHFLNADLFQLAFLQTLQPWREKIGVLIFEFSRFHPRDFAKGRDFVDALSSFLEALPKGWRYGVEVRNRSLLQPDYFAMLKQREVAHVFNAWTKMPTVSEQLDLEGSLDGTNFRTARLLLKQGRTYEEAVEKFSPYDQIKEPNLEAREAAAKLIALTLQAKAIARREKLFLYVNNRMEGCSAETILAIVKLLQLEKREDFQPRLQAKVKETLL
jgi:uncharacterized protein YecE (DUF72 family)